jgi:hypothetical protein
MKKLHQKNAGGDNVLSGQVANSASAKRDHSDVEKVLEHVLSPYRWELLDTLPVHSKAHVSIKSTNQEPKEK